MAGLHIRERIVSVFEVYREIVIGDSKQYRHENTIKETLNLYVFLRLLQRPIVKLHILYSIIHVYAHKTVCRDQISGVNFIMLLYKYRYLNLFI